MEIVTNTTIEEPSIDDDDSLNDMIPPSISQIYTDAAQYEKVLIQGGCTRHNSIGSEQEMDGISHLIGHDLEDPIQENVQDQLAKLSVTGDTFSSSELTSEPESYDGTDSSEDQSFDLETFPESASAADAESWKLSPVEIVDLLEQEFGPLVDDKEPKDCEELIFETDAGLFQDVVILGVAHLTTHRLAFHASLLDTKSNQHPSRQIIKSGPGIVHRQGWHAKRRVWLTLSHDMICSYASSRDEDRIRPLRTILLSQVKQVHPIDPRKPRTLRIVFNRAHKVKQGHVEFDTDESAQDWRRELEGALFVYRHSRRQVLNGSAAEDSDGIRLSIPLQRITKFDFTQSMNDIFILTLHLQLAKTDLNSDIALNEASQSESIIVQLVTIHKSPDMWHKLGGLVESAKAYHRQDTQDVSNVFVDFGSLSFFEEEEMGYVKDVNVQGKKEHAVRSALALGAESEVWIVRARIFCNIASSGYFALSPNYLGFWSKSFRGNDVHYRLSTSTVKEAKPFTCSLFRVNGLAVEIEGHEDLRFQFKTQVLRDEAIRRLNAAAAANRVIVAGGIPFVSSPTSSIKTSSSSKPPSTTSTGSTKVTTPSSASTGSTKVRSPTRSATGVFSPLSRTIAAATSHGFTEEQRLQLPKAINVPRETLSSLPPKHFMCLTIGSRGDVQPYIALALALQKEGHRVTIVTHEEYGGWIRGFGIEHRTAGGDPGALMKLSVENKMFSPEFFKESLTNFRPWLDQLLKDAWEQCQDAEVLLESPSAMAGVHIAEALNIPYFRTFTMPWTKTTQFPHAMLSPPVEAPAFNSASYVLFDNVLWTATSGQINRWRRHSLKIGNTDMGHLAQSKITFIYNFSQAVVPKPLDWNDTTIVSGYWFLDNPDLGWSPPSSLLQWMAKARKDQKPIVYIGFGSITVPHPRRVTKHIVEAVLKSDVRAIISKGWSARMSKQQNESDFEMPPECYSLDKVPHDWLFPQVDAVLHHGGAGTTGASLRAGVPTLIKPWFGDQYFWAARVQKLGAGLKVPSLRVSDLADALTKATTSRLMKEKAASIGERIRSEDGVHAAIQAIYTYFARASRERTTLA